MNALRSSMLVASCLVLAAAPAGCLSEPEPDALDDAVEPALAHPLDGPHGSGGPNGLMPLELFQSKKALLDSFAQSATLPPQNQAQVHSRSPSQLVNQLMATDAGKKTFKYAASCAFLSGDSVHRGGVSYPGNGMIRDAKMWFDQSLRADVEDEVLTCIAARLNPYGHEVQILMLGPAVNDDGVTDTEDYPFVEMVLRAHYNPNTDALVRVDVWPQEQLLAQCGDQVEASLGSRFCDNVPGACGLVLRKDFATACQGSPGAWSCDGGPAIETRLRTIDVGLMHPECHP